ncbi:MAG: LamG domain-containing protein, partial [Anaerolineales bacterium]|nr:LamG domain-containing protein [Anaerolineales bacterium]
MIGARGNFVTQGLHFDGAIDEIRIYDYGLTAEQAHRRWLDTKEGYSSNQTIVSQETSAGEEWICEATPNDATDDGAAMNSTALTIDTVPTQDTPYLNATDYTDNTTNANLTCWNKTTADIDGDGVTNIFTWWQNDVPLMGLRLPFDHDDSFAANATKDYSGHGSYGQLGAAADGDAAEPTWLAAGHIGGAYNFTGDNEEYIAVYNPNSNLDLYTEGAIMAWFKTSEVDVVSKDKFIIEGDSTNTGRWKLGITTGGDKLKCKFEDADNQAIGGAALTGVGDVGDKTWHHVALVYDGNDIVLYEDGENVASANDPGKSIHTITGPGYIGCKGNGLQCFNGTIDDVRVYNISLSGTQIKRIYEDTKNSYPSNETMTSDNTASADEWKCQITPNDARAGDGAIGNSTALTINTAPLHGTPYLNTTDYAANTTDANLTCWNVSTTDVDNDAITNIFTWLKNGVPIIARQFPFDHDDSYGANATADYSGYGSYAQLGTAADGDSNEPTWLSAGHTSGAYNFTGTNEEYITLFDDGDVNLNLYTEGAITLWFKTSVSDVTSKGIWLLDADDTNTGRWQLSVGTVGDPLKGRFEDSANNV